MLSTVLYYELAMKVPIPVGITVYLLTWGLGHLRCLVETKKHAHATTRIPTFFVSPENFVVVHRGNDMSFYSSLLIVFIYMQQVGNNYILIMKSVGV